MRKLWKRALCCFLIAGCFWLGTLIADRETLREELIRLHVVANSDSREDQEVKLQVKDAVVHYLQSALKDISDTEKAKDYIRDNLPKIEAIANQTLLQLGLSPDAVASFDRENFGKRIYDTFSLPAGVYDSLRITIGAGEGKNWWCVVFPTLCFSATAEEFDSIAAGAGFSDALTNAVTGEEVYELRFFFLDILGQLENILHQEK